MSIPQSFFELRDVRPIGGRPWIPLRQISDLKFEPPVAGIVELEEWIGIATAAVEAGARGAAEQLGWSNGLDVDAHRAGVESWGYCAADIFRDGKQPLGVNLVIDQFVEEESRSTWHLHPDLVVALDLLREGDCWYRPKEGWVEVVRLKQDEGGRPRLIEIRAEYLCDYLAARGFGLYCSTYCERMMVNDAKPAFSWPSGQFEEEQGRDRREGVTTNASYPHPAGRYWTRGALWRTEWIDPGTVSTRVRRDPDPHSSTFVLESDGTRVDASKLGGAIDWLYFDPALVMTLLRHRGASLGWFSEETGSLGATGSGVHFGVNDLGLITVFAKDIGRLQHWEQRLWSAHNVTPDGGVSRELFAAQMEVNPAATVAPEKQLRDALAELDAAFAARHGRPLLREDDSVMQLMRRAHRFVAAQSDGLLMLSKQLTRLFAERVDVDAVVAVISLPKSDRKPGSLKAMEKLVAHHRSDQEAEAMMAPLFGIYDLRLADAHLGSSKIASGLARAGVGDSDPAAMQGRQLLRAFVDTLGQIKDVLS